MQQKEEAEVLQFVGQQLGAILITLEGSRVGVNFEHNLGDGCIRSLEHDADFGHQLSICSRGEKNSTDKSWPVTDATGCVLTSRQTRVGLSQTLPDAC